MSSINIENLVYGGDVEDHYGMKNCTSLAELFLRRLKEIGNDVILIDAFSGEKLTALQLRERSIQLATCLEYSGIKPGDTISIYSENRFELVYVLLASIYLGVGLGLKYVDYTDEEYKNTVALLNPKIIFSSHSVLDKITKLAKEYDVGQVVVFGEKTEYHDIQTYSSFINNPSVKITENFIPKSIDIDDTVAIIMRTSGTTSAPKSVQMTHKNLLCAVWEYMKRETTPEPFILSSLPWVRPFGFRTMLRQIMHNSPMVFLPYFQERTFLKTIETYRPNTLNVYVTTMEFLARSSLVDEYDLSSVKIIFSCSAPQDIRIKQAIHKRLGIPVIQQGYGMSEFGTIADQSDQRHAIGSVGVLRRGVYGKVVDLMTNQNLGPYERGQLMFKGPNRMKGYIRNEMATRNAIDSDGWLHTGDYGYYDENYEWFIIDRIKDLIRSKDQIIPPSEIEALLKQHPMIEEAACIGIPDNEDGELPAAYIVRKCNQLTTENVQEFLKDKIKAEQQLNLIQFIKEIPADAAGKPSRLILRQMSKKASIKF